MLDLHAAPPEPQRRPTQGAPESQDSLQTVRKPALPALSGLRTILAVNVMFFHFTPPHPKFLTPVIDNAYVFVGFFFLISGFILAYNYADRPTLSKQTFYLARLSRVYPVYLLVLLLSLPFLPIEWGAHTPAQFYRGLLLTPLALQGWNPMLATFWNTVAWDGSGGVHAVRFIPFCADRDQAVCGPAVDAAQPDRRYPRALGDRHHAAHGVLPAEPGPPDRARDALYLRVVAAAAEVHAAHVSVHVYGGGAGGAAARNSDLERVSPRACGAGGAGRADAVLRVRGGSGFLTSSFTARCCCRCFRCC